MAQMTRGVGGGCGGRTAAPRPSLSDGTDAFLSREESPRLRLFNRDVAGAPTQSVSGYGADALYPPPGGGGCVSGCAGSLGVVLATWGASSPGFASLQLLPGGGAGLEVGGLPRQQILCTLVISPAPRGLRGAVAGSSRIPGTCRAGSLVGRGGCWQVEGTPGTRCPRELAFRAQGGHLLPSACGRSVLAPPGPLCSPGLEQSGRPKSGCRLWVASAFPGAFAPGKEGPCLLPKPQPSPMLHHRGRSWPPATGSRHLVEDAAPTLPSLQPCASPGFWRWVEAHPGGVGRVCSGGSPLQL